MGPCYEEPYLSAGHYSLTLSFLLLIYAIILENMAHKEEICEKKIPGKIDSMKNVKAKKGKEYAGARKMVP